MRVETIGTFTQQPYLEVQIRHLRRHGLRVRDVMIASRVIKIRPVALYRHIPADWTPAVVKEKVCASRAREMGYAGGITWRV